MNSTKQFIYTWQGITKQGVRCEGQQMGIDVKSVKDILLKQNILPLHISKQKISLLHHKRIHFNDITLFARQMTTLLAAGIPIIKTLDIIANTQEKPAVNQLLFQLKNDIATGHSLTEALKKQPKYFNKIFCNLIAAGEISGTLEQAFDRVAQQREKFAALKVKVNKALFYPATILSLSVLICCGLLIFVVPQFANLFQSFGAELPLATRIVIQLASVIQNYALLFIFISTAILCLFRIFKQKVFAFALFCDRWQLKLPIMGSILQKAIIASFSRTLASLFAAGIPLIDALHTVAPITNNALYLNASHQISNAISHGQTLKMAVQQTHLFPSLVIQMINVGEETGTLEHMLFKLATIYEDEVNNAVESLTTLLEPLIMLILGTLIGGLVIAMYLPIFKLGSVIH